MLHLYRKKESEKVFWWSVLGTFVAVLAILAIWQFGIREHLIRKQEKQDDYLQRQQPALNEEPSAAE